MGSLLVDVNVSKLNKSQHGGDSFLAQPIEKVGFVDILVHCGPQKSFSVKQNARFLAKIVLRST